MNKCLYLQLQLQLQLLFLTFTVIFFHKVFAEQQNINIHINKKLLETHELNHYLDNIDIIKEWVFVRYNNKHENNSFFSDFEYINDIIERFNFPLQFVEEQTIGRFHIYVLKGSFYEIMQITQITDNIMLSENYIIEAGPGFMKTKNYTLENKNDNYYYRSNIKKQGKSYIYHGKHHNNYRINTKLIKNNELTCRHAPSHVNKGFVNGVFSWGLDRSDQRSRPMDCEFCTEYTGENVDAYIVDTGISQHSTFKNNVHQDYSYFDPSNIPLGDCNGHGTHVAGLVGSNVYGVAPDVILHAIKVLSCQGFGSFASMLAGLAWVFENHDSSRPAVINLSLGVRGSSSSSVQNMIESLINEKSIPVVVSAGNFNEDACNTFPASISQVITVGATDPIDIRASFSNDGSCVNIFAPGVEIISTSNSGGSLILSGTSMSAPITTGIVVLLLDQNPNLNPTQIKSSLYDHSTKNAIAQNSLVSGTPNRLVFIEPIQNSEGGDGNFNDRDDENNSNVITSSSLLLSLILYSYLSMLILCSLI